MAINEVIWSTKMRELLSVCVHLQMAANFMKNYSEKQYWQTEMQVNNSFSGAESLIFDIASFFSTNS